MAEIDVAALGKCLHGQGLTLTELEGVLGRRIGNLARNLGLFSLKAKFPVRAAQSLASPVDLRRNRPARDCSLRAVPGNSFPTSVPEGEA